MLFRSEECCCAFVGSFVVVSMRLVLVSWIILTSCSSSSSSHPKSQSCCGLIGPFGKLLPSSLSFFASASSFLTFPFLFVLGALFSFEVASVFRFLLVLLFALSWFCYPSWPKDGKVLSKFCWLSLKNMLRFCRKCSWRT